MTFRLQCLAPPSQIDAPDAHDAAARVASFGAFRHASPAPLRASGETWRHVENGDTNARRQISPEAADSDIPGTSRDLSPFCRQTAATEAHAATVGDTAPLSPLSPSPTVRDHPDLECRRARVEHVLAEQPEKRIAWNVVNAPLRSEPGEPVSVVIGVRAGDGSIISGECVIERQRFDAALFLHILTETCKRPS